MELLSDDEFIREHRTICEVCECGAFPDADDDDWGPLLLCSTCACAFHVPCSRPALGGPPREDQQWRCSYCVLASEPKYTKPRRIAAAAVRLMARWVTCMRGLLPPSRLAASRQSRMCCSLLAFFVFEC
jgi:hypothetical protein